MQTINISAARAQLSDLINKVFTGSQSFLITKGGIPVAKIIKADSVSKKTKKTKKDIEKALKLAKSIKWLWNRDEWKDKSSVEISNLLRERVQKRHVY